MRFTRVGDEWIGYRVMSGPSDHAILYLPMLASNIDFVGGNSDARLFYELYRDRAAFHDHEAQPHTRRFLAERGQYLIGFDVDELSVTVAKGI